MKLIIHDTYKLYQELLSLPEGQRENFYADSIMAPFLGMFQIMGTPIKPESTGCMPLMGRDEETAALLERLKAGEAWKTAQEAVEESASRLEAAGVQLPEEVVLGIFIGKPDFLVQNQGITGFGGIPGYIQVVIVPDEHNMKLLPAVTAHEFHHNVLFKNAKWSFMEVTLAKYLAVEGLAESFAQSLYGQEGLGPWVKGLQGEELDRARKLIGEALDTKGFMEVRKYMFGDPAAGIPQFAGYAVGYHAVQAFIQAAGVSVEKATLLEGEEIMARSNYFK